MPWNDEWSGLADFLANMIEKYAGEMDLDTLPDPDNYFKMKRIKEHCIFASRFYTLFRAGVALLVVS